MSHNTLIRGAYYENLAAQFLASKGFTLITKNFRAQFGEIDLIMRDNTTLVFIEVRYRKNHNYGLPVQTVTTHKQQKLIKTAKLFLCKHGLYEKVDCRFDVVGIELINNEPEYHWIPNAF